MSVGDATTNSLACSKCSPGSCLKPTSHYHRSRGSIQRVPLYADDPIIIADSLGELLLNVRDK